VSGWTAGEACGGLLGVVVVVCATAVLGAATVAAVRFLLGLG
jgi:hypothetical protein